MKNIAVNIVCGVTATGIAAAIAFAWNEFLLPMQSVSPPAFLLFALSCIIAGGSIGFLVSWNAKKLSAEKKTEELEKQVAELEKRPTQEQFDEAIELHREEAEHARIIENITSLNIRQAGLVAQIFKKGEIFNIPTISRDFQTAELMSSVFDASTIDGEYGLITLTPEWNAIMNQHGDEFFKIWNQKKANLLD